MPQIASTQELDARFSVFLNPIRDLTKNWEVDIAKYLEEYLEELAEVQITFDGGETLMNFAEAAMLIQGSATVYSKKVEFLWQMVLQMLDLLSSRRNVETAVAGGKETGGGGKALLDHSMDFNKVDNIGEGRNIDLREDEDDEEDLECCKRKSFKFLPATPLHLVEKDGEKSQNRVSLLMKNGEVFGAKDDFRINRSYLTPMGMLCMEVPSEILRDAALRLLNSPDPVNEGDAEAASAGTCALPAEPQASDALPQGPGVHDAVEDDQGVDVDGAADPADFFDDQQPMNIEEEEGREKTDEGKEEAKNNNSLNVIDLPNGRYGLRKRGGNEKEVIVTLKLTDPWKPLDPHAETPAKRPVRAGRLRRPPPCACHRQPLIAPRRKSIKKNENTDNDKKAEKSLPSVESYITGELAGIIGSSTKNRKIPPELAEEVNKEVAKRLELNKCKKVKDLLKEGAAIDVEEALQKVTEDLENRQRVDEELDDPLDCDGVADLDVDGDDLPAPPLFLPEPHDTTRQPDVVSQRLSDSNFDEPGSNYEALVQKWVADYITNAQEHVTSSSLVKRVNKWRENIMPKLDEEEHRRQFDIHRYGSQVLSHFPENGRKQTVSFSTVAKGVEAWEVSRLFLSCLMLANTYNIELSESQPGEFAMDCLELTLLSRVRHHEELEEYAAPSQASPPLRKDRSKTKVRPNTPPYEPGVYSGEPPPICADITQITLAADNVQYKSKEPTKGRSRTKR
ncbi:condensin-2 complex subunit H2 [Procambarus clarkii]|uniref:condensin-2 complex subunit H2 n=1 Tax=Procambarus clarkii TaxID=6728 RepID=UPI003743977A